MVLVRLLLSDFSLVVLVLVLIEIVALWDNLLFIVSTVFKSTLISLITVAIARSRAIHIMRVCSEHDVNRSQVLLTSSTSLTQFSIFTLDVFDSFLKLVISVCKLSDFLLRFFLSSNCSILLSLVEVDASRKFSTLTFEPHVVLMKLVDFTYMILRSSLEFTNQPFNLVFVLLNLAFHAGLLSL